ncbi:MAG: ASKHA domain-containing protein [Lysobacterales bacterium]
MPNVKKAQILFSPSGKRGRFPVGTPVLQAARELGVDIDSICGGRARCARCQVEPVEGVFPKEAMVSSPAHLSELTENEMLCLNNGQLGHGNRLSCQARILADVRIDVPAASQLHQQVVRKEYEAHPIELNPVIRLYFTEVSEPDLQHPDGDEQRLEQALKRDWGLSGLVLDLEVLQSLQAALRDGNWQVTVAVRDAGRIVAIWAGFRDKIYGAAVDVGSTTIAVHLCDLLNGEVLASAGAMNPQIRYGEDLMSRVSYAMQNPGGAAQLTTVVRQAINDLLVSVTEQAKVDIDHLLELTFVGNPVMHHLLLGLDPAPLGVSPFALATGRAIELAAGALDLRMPAGSRAYVLPCIAGHVGADTSAVLLAEKPWESDETSLVIDIGTNAEIILGNRKRVLAASSPTGPAFEGAQISAGQRAAPGAIERVRIDAETLEPRFKLVGGNCWSDEPGFDRETGGAGITGICGSGMIEAVATMYLAGIIRPDGVIDDTLAGRNSRIEAVGRTCSYLLHKGEPDIRISQSDVRAIQLAKAALYAGAQLLMKRMDVDRVDRIRLAGAFGSHIDVKYAMVLGMLPDCPLERVSSANNAAGTGARIALLDKASRRDIENRVRDVEKMETATEKSFQQYFIEALAIPHATRSFPMLSKAVDLPDAVAGTIGSKRKRRSTD